MRVIYYYESILKIIIILKIKSIYIFKNLLLFWLQLILQLVKDNKMELVMAI